MSIAQRRVRIPWSAKQACFSSATVKITVLICPKSKSCRRCWTPWACLWLPMWCRVTGPMIPSTCPVSRDCKMAARETRAVIASRGDYYLCPLPQMQHADDELDEVLEAIWSGKQPLIPVTRERAEGKPEVIAEGSEYRMPMSLAIEGEEHVWSERRLVVRSLRQAQA